jgi:hypothetical protein
MVEQDTVQHELGVGICVLMDSAFISLGAQEYNAQRSSPLQLRQSGPRTCVPNETRKAQSQRSCRMHVRVVKDSVNTVLQAPGMSTRQRGDRLQHTVIRGAKSQ